MKRNLTTTLLFLLFVSVSWAQTFPEPMNPPRLVNDFVNFFTPQEVELLEQKLVTFNKETSNQIVVLTVDDLQGLEPSEYAIRIFDKWGIGGKGKDNGILILIKPKTANERGELFIGAGVKVYAGMVVGQTPKDMDIDVNVCRKKQLTNMRSAGADDALRLVPPRELTLEWALEFINDDELVEITPGDIRLRKAILDANLRRRASR